MTKVFLITILAILFCVTSSEITKNLNKNSNLKKSKQTCYVNCENPVYLINRNIGLTLDIYNDQGKEAAKHYSKVKLTNHYNTWCIRSDNRIQSNVNNFILTYLGTVKCGATGVCQWDSSTNIKTFPEGEFTNQQVWNITLEATGFTSFKETLTTSGGLYDRQGWLVPSEKNGASLRITESTDFDGQWIVAPAPKCS